MDKFEINQQISKSANQQISKSAILIKKNNLLKFGLSLYVLFIVLALIFYKERTFFVDISFHLFYILKDGFFTIQNFRFGAFITQLFPLLGSKMGLDLEAIAKLYSVGFVLYYLLLFIVILKGFLDKSMAIMLLLFNTVFVTHGFFWIQSELPQGIAFTLMYFALLHFIINREKVPVWVFAILPPFIMTLAFFNPLIVFLVTFLTLFFVFHFKERRRLYGMFWIAYIVIYIFKSLFFKTAYDEGANALWSNWLAYYPDLLSIPSHMTFIKYLIFDYYILTILFCWVLIYYIRTSRFKKFFLTLISFIVYAFIVNLNYPSDTVQFYIENQYLPLSVFVITPFVYDVLPAMKKESLILAILIGISLFAIGRFWQTSQIYTARVDCMRNILHQTNRIGQKKLVLSQNQLPMDTLFMTWASPYEFWLLSTIEEGSTRSVVVEESPTSLDWTMSRTDAFVTNWGVFDYSSLDTRYFILQDESSYGKSELIFK